MRRVVIVAAALTLTACDANGGDDPGGPSSASLLTTTTVESTPASAPTTTEPPSDDPATTDAPPPDPTSSTAPTTRPSSTVTTTTLPPRVGNPDVAAEVVGRFDQPVDLAVRPGDDALWIVEQRGRVVRLDGDASSVALDIGGELSTSNEQGLLGLAFSPDGSSAYTNHTDRSGTTTITEWPVGGDATFDAAGRRTVLTVAQPFSNHNAGDLQFGPDGYLYIPLGDGGSGGDPERNGADPTTLLGSLLRIDPTPTGDASYGIPADNPFGDGSVGDVTGAPEVWAWGLRNPWKIDLDPATGRLWIADVGQNRFEEINMVGPIDGRPAGFAADFGWSAFEGTARFDDGVPDRGDALTSPVLTYSHDDGCSISGGAVYRGEEIPELEPAFVYGDFCAGTIWALDLEGGRNLTLVEGVESVTAIRRGPGGELYVLQRSGDVLRLVPG